MVEKTDDDHVLTMPQIIQQLEGYGVSADRKSLYDDIETLRVLGIDVIGEKRGKSFTYHVGSKKFDVAELKLLVDSIQSSKFITERKSNDLIKKLTEFASEYEASQLKRQVVVKGRVKTMNESIYYLVDDIHNAIINNRRITFEYLKWNVNKEMEPRRESLYEVSPWVLTWDDENYYLIGFDSHDGIIKHYRVDKMRNITVTEELREGRDHFEHFDLAAYSRMSFGMFGGEDVKVRLSFRDDMAGVILDRFGKDITILPGEDEGWHETHVNVALSDQFFGWIFSIGTGVRIAGPVAVVEKYRDLLDQTIQMYKSL